MRPGDVLRVREQCWTLARAESFDLCTILTLEGRGPDNAGRVFHAITPFDRVDTVPVDRPRRRKRRTVLRAAFASLAHERPACGLWTAADAHLDLHGYQLEPALAVLRGAPRVLLADAVGLGKTVQAGLILAELRARGLVDRALILCPAGLREAWVSELRDRFAIAATVLDYTAIAQGGHESRHGLNPWSVHPVIVASIDFVKRPEVMAAVEEAAFDLVIADEAHHLTPGSDRGHAVNRLAERVPWFVMVTATPHSGDHAAFNYLTALGSLGDPLVTFRRTRRDLGLRVDRRSRLLSVTPTIDETRLLRATDDYARAIWHARGQSDRAVQLVAITLTRRAASSAAGLAHTLARRRTLLSDPPPSAPTQAVLPWDEVDEDDGDELDERLARPGLPDAHAERRQLDALIELARRASAHPSKLHRLRRLLIRAREPAVVFTEYRDTLSAAADLLGPELRVGVIHGGVPAPMRQEVLRQFDAGGLDVLLATDTAGEGLNLHRRCRLVVDLELPWNPLRLEQRIGRVDRLGQQRRVHAVHLLHRGSIEDRVWQHMEQRRRRAGEALGDLAEVAGDSITEQDVARTVFDHVALPSSTRTTFATIRVDATSELARIACQRRWRAHMNSAFDRPVYCCPRRYGRYLWEAIALHERATFGATAGLIERRIHATAVTIDRVRTVTDWQPLVAEVSRASSDQGPPLVWKWPAVLARIATARQRLASAPPLHQASLFDRRAERLTHSRREVVAHLDTALARRAESLRTVDWPAVQSRLVAFWPRWPTS